MKTIVKLTIAFSVAVLTLGAQQVLAANVYVAGTCKPSFKSFAHIQDALNATPSPTTVLVCASSTPYTEQITITQPVNLQGIPNGDADQAIIAPPAGGLTQVASTTDFGLVHFQIYVNNVSGPVNISNLTVDGTNNGLASGNDVVGIFFQNSPGSVSRVVVSNHTGTGFGVGIWLEGGSAVPAVTVTGSSIREFDSIGIFSETFGAGSSELNTTISGNSVVSGGSSASGGLEAGQGATTNISGNLVSVFGPGISTDGLAEGSVSGNTVVGNGANTGYLVSSDVIAVTGNKIFHTNTGIGIVSVLATVQGNSITNSTVGIDYGCNANPNVIHNTISDAPTGINDVPSGLSVSNTYFNVPTIRSQGICP